MVVFIALISIIPFGFAWYLAKNPELIKNRPTVNHGHLITPARPLDYAELMDRPISSADTLPEIKGHWVMVQVTQGPGCDAVCKETAQKTGRLRLMLNKEIARVRRLLLLPGPADATAAAATELAQQDPTLLMAGLSDTLRQRLQDAIGAPLSEGVVLLLDPLGNVMMWYGPGTDPYSILHDLQRLLKNSQIG
jgi:hypothetical protein